MKNRILRLIPLLALALTFGCHSAPKAPRKMGATGPNTGAITINSSGIDLKGLPLLHVATPSASTDGANKSYADTKYASTTPLQSITTATASVPLGGQKLTGLANGTASTDSAAFGQIAAALNASTYSNTVNAVATTNVASLTGLAVTVDGVALSSAGMRVLAPSQTTTTQDACYVVASGAWTVCPDMAVGTSAEGKVFVAESGTANKGVWVIHASGAQVVGTNDLTAANVAASGGSVTFAAVQSALAGATSSVALNGQALTGASDPTNPQDVATKNYVDTRGFRVGCATVSALPTYTVTGGVGVGSTITANANGAFPALDTTCTVNAGDLFYLVNGISAVDNGIYVLNAAGSGGSTWNATRFVGLDQATELPGSRFTVKGGLLRGGGEYIYNALATPVMGTTHLFWHRTDARITPLEGLRSRNDFTSVLTIGANANAPVPGSTEMLAITSGTASAMSSNVTNTSSIRGVYSFSSGTVATDVGGFQGGFTAAVTAPDGGDSIFISQDMGWDVTWVIAIPVLANGTDTFATDVGWSHTRNNSQKLPSDFVGLLYDETSGVTTTDWILAAAAGGVSTGTVTDTGITITAGQYYRIQSRKDPGDNTLRYWIDGVSVGTITSNVPTIAVSQLVMSFKSVGIGNINFLRAASFSQDLDFPTGLTG